MTIVFTAGAIVAYDPARGLIARRGGAVDDRAASWSRGWRWALLCGCGGMPRRRAARSRLAVPADQGAAAVAGGGVVRSAAGCAAGSTGGRTSRWPNWCTTGAAPRTARAGAGEDPCIRSAGGRQKQAKLLALLAALFNVLDEERSTRHCRARPVRRSPEGTCRATARRQREAARDAGGSAADAGEVNQLMQQVTWEAQVFQDRRQALSYACDVPAQDRAATVRAGAHDPAGAAMNVMLTSAACGRGIGRAQLQRQVVRRPAVGAVRIPGDVGIAERQRALRRVPRHPAIRQAVEHEHAIADRRRWPVAGRARSTAPSPEPARRSRCPAARRCRVCLRAASAARSSRPADRQAAAAAAARRRTPHRAAANAHAASPVDSTVAPCSVAGTGAR